MATGDRCSVALIFPPLIESNFGSFFPSTAVLAAFLEENGIPCVQEDLNEAFALHLLSDEILGRLEGGDIPGVAKDSAVAVAAKWAARNRPQFIDEAGRHRFGTRQNDASVQYVMKLIARPFMLDPGGEALKRIDTRAHPFDVFERFYEVTRIADRIPADAALIGISVPMGPQLEASLLLASFLKQRRPDTPVVLGGPTFSLMTPEDLETLLLHHSAVDCVVRFDGESPLLELAQRARDGEFSPEGVAGSSYRRGIRVHHKPAAPGLNLNKLPPPSYPEAALNQLADPVLGITQARGCYWGKCDYCDFVELFDGSPPFRGRHPDLFVDEIETLIRRTGVRRFRFITESIPPAFARRMSELIIERGINIAWSSFAMVDRRFDRELLRVLVNAGCEHLVIGLETTNTRILKLVHKSADREENIRFIKDAKAVGLKLVINLIPDLPSTTYREALDTLEDIKQLADCIDSINVFEFEPTRSSNVGRNPENFGLIRAITDDNTSGQQAQYALNHLDSIDPAMTAKERREIHQKYRALAEKVSGRRIPRSLLISFLSS